MKKLGRKLLLSSLSLGLAVVTFSTTTFAWYTSNTEASVNAVSGATAGTTDSTLLISATQDGAYSTTATPFTVVDGSKMVPLQLKKAATTGGLFALTGSAVSAEEKGYLQFSFYVKTTREGVNDSTNKVPVYIESVTATNKTSSLPVYDVLKSHESFTGTTYQVDAVRTLAFAVNTSTNLDGINTCYSYSNLFTSSAKTESGFSETTSNIDAIGYYNAVMGGTLSKPTSELATTQELETISASDGTQAYSCIKVCDLTSNSGQLVVVTVWLDGWDNYCFDGCQKQEFDFSVKLTTSLGKVTTTISA